MSEHKIRDKVINIALASGLIMTPFVSSGQAMEVKPNKAANITKVKVDDKKGDKEEEQVGGVEERDIKDINGNVSPFGKEIKNEVFSATSVGGVQDIPLTQNQNFEQPEQNMMGIAPMAGDLEALTIVIINSFAAPPQGSLVTGFVDVKANPTLTYTFPGDSQSSVIGHIYITLANPGKVEIEIIDDRMIGMKFVVQISYNANSSTFYEILVNNTNPGKRAEIPGVLNTNSANIGMSQIIPQGQEWDTVPSVPATAPSWPTLEVNKALSGNELEKNWFYERARVNLTHKQYATITGGVTGVLPYTPTALGYNDSVIVLYLPLNSNLDPNKPENYTQRVTGVTYANINNYNFGPGHYLVRFYFQNGTTSQVNTMVGAKLYEVRTTSFSVLPRELAPSVNLINYDFKNGEIYSCSADGRVVMPTLEASDILNILNVKILRKTQEEVISNIPSPNVQGLLTLNIQRTQEVTTDTFSISYVGNGSNRAVTVTSARGYSYSQTIGNSNVTLSIPLGDGTYSYTTTTTAATLTLAAIIGEKRVLSYNTASPTITGNDGVSYTLAANATRKYIVSSGQSYIIATDGFFTMGAYKYEYVENDFSLEYALKGTTYYAMHELPDGTLQINNEIYVRKGNNFYQVKSGFAFINGENYQVLYEGTNYTSWLNNNTFYAEADGTQVDYAIHVVYQNSMTDQVFPFGPHTKTYQREFSIVHKKPTMDITSSTIAKNKGTTINEIETQKANELLNHLFKGEVGMNFTDNDKHIKSVHVNFYGASESLVSSGLNDKTGTFEIVYNADGTIASINKNGVDFLNGGYSGNLSSNLQLLFDEWGYYEVTMNYEKNPNPATTETGIETIWFKIADIVVPKPQVDVFLLGGIPQGRQVPPEFMNPDNVTRRNKYFGKVEATFADMTFLASKIEVIEIDKNGQEVVGGFRESISLDDIPNGVNLVDYYKDGRMFSYEFSPGRTNIYKLVLTYSEDPENPEPEDIVLFFEVLKYIAPELQNVTNRELFKGEKSVEIPLYDDEIYTLETFKRSSTVNVIDEGKETTGVKIYYYPYGLDGQPAEGPVEIENVQLQTGEVWHKHQLYFNKLGLYVIEMTYNDEKGIEKIVSEKFMIVTPIEPDLLVWGDTGRILTPTIRTNEKGEEERIDRYLDYAWAKSPLAYEFPIASYVDDYENSPNYDETPDGLIISYFLVERIDE
ncbi:MAG: hypothetical protein LBV67_00990, partial [Streptococcaceae bacterium]|nr:hypothetical protein [Streptococcaceae bacterium]